RLTNCPVPNTTSGAPTTRLVDAPNDNGTACPEPAPPVSGVGISDWLAMVDGSVPADGGSVGGGLQPDNAPSRTASKYAKVALVRVYNRCRPLSGVAHASVMA